MNWIKKDLIPALLSALLLGGVAFGVGSAMGVGFVYATKGTIMISVVNQGAFKESTNEQD